VDRQPVESSLIRSVGYDPASCVLEVELRDPPRVYEYFDVPFSTYEELLFADSKGEYFNDQIRDLFACQEVYAEDGDPNEGTG
jgi:hypothetical protein